VFILKILLTKLMAGALMLSMFAIPSISASAAGSDIQTINGQINPGTRDITVLQEMDLGIHQVSNTMIMSDSKVAAIGIDDFTGSQTGYTMSVTLDSLTHSTEGNLMATGFNLEIGTGAKVIGDLLSTELHTQNTVNMNSVNTTGDLFTMDYTQAAQDEDGRMVKADSTMSLVLPINKTVPGLITAQVTYEVIDQP
jgi:hypothetical protein